MMTNLYEFRVDGQLTDQAREAFCDMRIEEIPAGATLYGDVIDESHLLGIMAQCRMLGLVVISAHPVSPVTPCPARRRAVVAPERPMPSLGGRTDPAAGPRVAG